MNIYQDLPRSATHQLSLHPEKARRLRIVWFALGSLVGVLLTCVTHTIITSTPQLFSTGNLQAAFIDSLQKEEVIAPPIEHAASATETLQKAAAAPDITPELKASAAISPVTSTAPEPEPNSFSLMVEKGDTLLDMLTDAGVLRDEAYHIVEVLTPTYDPRKLRPGQTFMLEVDATDRENVQVERITIDISPIEKVLVTRTGEGKFHVEREDTPVVRKTARAGGTITNSLYQTVLDNGMPEPLVARLISAYSYDVDFQRDIKHGDSVEVLFEHVQTETGMPVMSDGKVLHATLTLGNKKIPVYSYTDRKGNMGYYNAKGESVRKALLKTPVNGARISSRYGKRRHPVLGYTKMHKGVDFAAPTGTPVYAAGDGVVERANRHGGYGNYVRLRHNGKYATAYAHLHRFGKGIRAGKRVKQGQVIGYVGSTGRSTGPHLHYEILANNRQVNPSGIKFKTGRTLKGPELARFKVHAQEMNSLLASLPRAKTDMASAK